MAQHAIELILFKQLASYLDVPVFLVDLEGNLLFYNEPAETILGERYEETGEMPVGEWSTKFTPIGDDGAPLGPDDLPLVRTMQTRMPATGPMTITGMDKVTRRIMVTAVPIVGQGGRDLASVALFWEQPAQP